MDEVSSRAVLAGRGAGPVIALVLVSVGAAGRPAVAGQALPGDAIDGYRVVAIDRAPGTYWHWQMKLEVSYSYNAAHGSAIAGAAVLPGMPGLESGHGYWGSEGGPLKPVEESRTGDLVRGLQRTVVSVRITGAPARTEQLRLYLYTPQGGEFVSRSFGEVRVWSRPPDVPDPNAPALPDLVITAATYEPASPVRAGTVLRFRFRVTNQGNAPASGIVRVTGPGNSSGAIGGGLQPGESKEVIVEYPVYSVGTTYRMRFAVNVDAIIKESNHENNSTAEFVIQTLN